MYVHMGLYACVCMCVCVCSVCMCVCMCMCIGVRACMGVYVCARGSGCVFHAYMRVCDARLCLLFRTLRTMITKTTIIMAKATTATTTPITIIITIMFPLLLPFEPVEDTAESTLLVA